MRLKPPSFAPDATPGRAVTATCAGDHTTALPKRPRRGPAAGSRARGTPPAGACRAALPREAARRRRGRGRGRRAGGGTAALQKKQARAAALPLAARFASPGCSMEGLPRTVELFYDVLSPYSWLGFEVTPGEPHRPRLGGRGQREERAQGTGRRDCGLVKFLELPDGV